MVYANQILFGGGLGLTSATDAALILALGPIASASLADAVFREPLRPRRLVGILIGLGGPSSCSIARELSSPGAAWVTC